MTDRDAPTQDLAAAWQELGRALRAFFARRVPAAEVDDLLQECYLRVSQGLPALHDRERFGAWVFRIARHLVADRHRRRRRAPREQEVLDEPAVGGDEPDLDLRVAGWLSSMIEQLPAKYAEALRLSELEELPHRAIAARLGLSVSGVKSRVQRGRALLRAELLACCALEFDRRGGVRDYRRNAPGSCDC